MYDTAGNLTQWHDKDGGTVTSYAYYPWGQMRRLHRTGFERQYAYTADGQRIVTRDPGTGRLTVTLRGLDTKVRRVVEQHSGQWTWVKDYVTRGGLHAATVSAAEGERHFSLDHLGSIRQMATRVVAIADGRTAEPGCGSQFALIDFSGRWWGGLPAGGRRRRDRVCRRR